MYSSRSNRSIISTILHSAGFLPLVFVVVSITLWTMFINSYHNKTSSKETIYSSEYAATSFSDEKYFEQQNIIIRPESNIQDIQTLTMELMKKYQNLPLADDKKYIEALDESYSLRKGVNKSTTTQEKQVNQMKFRSALNEPDTLQNGVNKLMQEPLDQDTADTDYMNNLNINSVTSVIKENDRQVF